MADILAIGELLIDLTAMTGDDGEVYYKRNAGGAPANVVCMAAGLGASTGLIGKVGDDMFGKYLKKILDDKKVDTKGLILDKEHSTTLAFISNRGDGERDYVFFRKNTADLDLKFSEIDKSLIDKCKIFHFGSLSLTAEPSRSATVNAVEYAKSQGKIISYDPNWRPLLWQSREMAIRTMTSVLRYVDILKVSEEELQLITDCGTMLPAIAKLLGMGIKIICITQGAKGCIIAAKGIIERYPTYNAKTVDTLGSGDSFFGGFLYKLLEKSKDITELTADEFKEMAYFANACGSYTSTKVGAIPAMPDSEQIRKFMSEHELLR
ncbi:MAG: carbohydrate kinase [Oscillospiraceae bacterium]|nr:carbohydrate kinase [Oscillospiraceae bacterium]